LHEYQPRRAETQFVASRKERSRPQTSAVDERTVGRPEIDQPKLLEATLQDRVFLGNGTVAEDQVILGIGTYGDFAFYQPVIEWPGSADRREARPLTKVPRRNSRVRSTCALEGVARETSA
jgi:hypothetical protein